MKMLKIGQVAVCHILRVVRTIADIDSSVGRGAGRMTEAIGYRRLDRKFQ